MGRIFPPFLRESVSFPTGLAYSLLKDQDRRVRLWDLEGRHGERLIGSHSHASDSVAYAPDGRILATAGEDGAVRLWDLATGTERRRVGGPADQLYGVAFSPDGQMLAAAGTDSDIRLWDLAEVLGSRNEPSRCCRPSVSLT
jgi:WD40 repeat protein